MLARRQLEGVKKATLHAPILVAPAQRRFRANPVTLVSRALREVSGLVRHSGEQAANSASDWVRSLGWRWPSDVGVAYLSFDGGDVDRLLSLRQRVLAPATTAVEPRTTARVWRELTILFRFVQHLPSGPIGSMRCLGVRADVEKT